MSTNGFTTFTNTDIVGREPANFTGNQSKDFQIVKFADGSMGIEKSLNNWVGNKTGRKYPAELLAVQEYLAARVGEALDAPVRDCLFTSTDGKTVIMPLLVGKSGRELGEIPTPDDERGVALQLFDYLTANSDRRPKNVMFTDDGVVGIDHALCNFRERTPSDELVATLAKAGFTSDHLELLMPALEVTKSHFQQFDLDQQYENLVGNLVRLIEATRRLESEVVKSEVIKSGDTFTPPQGVQSAAKRALEYMKDGKAGSGFTSVGRKRASQLANGQAVSEDTIRRMKAYFDRHQSDKDSPHWDEPSPGKVAWLAWGGDAGWSWAKSVVERLDRQEETKKSLTPTLAKIHYQIISEAFEVEKERFGHAFHGNQWVGENGKRYADSAMSHRKKADRLMGKKRYREASAHYNAAAKYFGMASHHQRSVGASEEHHVALEQLSALCLSHAKAANEMQNALDRHLYISTPKEKRPALIEHLEAQARKLSPRLAAIAKSVDEEATEYDELLEVEKKQWRVSHPFYGNQYTNWARIHFSTSLKHKRLAETARRLGEHKLGGLHRKAYEAHQRAEIMANTNDAEFPEQHELANRLSDKANRKSEGILEIRKESEATEIEKGDRRGHDFHGNQYQQVATIGDFEAWKRRREAGGNAPKVQGARKAPAAKPARQPRQAKPQPAKRVAPPKAVKAPKANPAKQTKTATLEGAYKLFKPVPSDGRLMTLKTPKVGKVLGKPERLGGALNIGLQRVETEAGEQAIVKHVVLSDLLAMEEVGGLVGAAIGSPLSSAQITGTGQASLIQPFIAGKTCSKLGMSFRSADNASETPGVLAKFANPTEARKEFAKIAFFDHLTGNPDRHSGNVMVGQDGLPVGIDQGLCFFPGMGNHEKMLSCAQTAGYTNDDIKVMDENLKNLLNSPLISDPRVQDRYLNSVMPRWDKFVKAWRSRTN